MPGMIRNSPGMPPGALTATSAWVNTPLKTEFASGTAVALARARAPVLLVAVPLGTVGEGGRHAIGERRPGPVVEPRAHRVDVALHQLVHRTDAVAVQAQLVGLEGRVVGDQVEVEPLVGRIIVTVGEAERVGPDLLVHHAQAARALAVVRFPGIVSETGDAALQPVVVPELVTRLGEGREDVVFRVLEPAARRPGGWCRCLSGPRCQGDQGRRPAWCRR